MQQDAETAAENADAAIVPSQALVDKINDRANSLIIAASVPLDQNPAAVYLARLTPGGQRTMGEALNTIAAMLTNGQANALTCQWPTLRFQHTAAVRARLATTYKPATANRMICALRGTLKMAWLIGSSFEGMKQAHSLCLSIR